MKRKALLRRLIALICVLAIAALLFWPRAFTYHLEEITMVRFCGGPVGYVQITDQEQIEAVVQMFHENRFWRFGFIPRLTGKWDYRFQFFQGNELITQIAFTSSGRIDGNGFFNSAIDGVVNLDFYRAMLPLPE